MKIANGILLVCFAVLAFGCAPANHVPAEPLPAAPHHDLTQAEEATIKAAIVYNMKDPASAMFRNFEGYQMPDGTVKVCGEVNGRNSFGGYTGFQGFTGYLSAGKFTTSEMAHDDLESEFMIQNCKTSK